LTKEADCKKHTSLLRYEINYSCEIIYDTSFGMSKINVLAYYTINYNEKGSITFGTEQEVGHKSALM